MKGEVHIQTSLRNNVTFLQKAYCTPPFKVGNITEDKKNKVLRLMLMSSSPGILDGDHYRITVDVGENNELVLSSQSYQRLFAMQKGASQEIIVTICKGGTFFYLPHPCVPHRSSSFVSRNKFYLNKNSTLLWGEILTCGRKLSGEAFQFSRYQSISEIYVEGKLVIKENLLVEPSVKDMNAIGQLEGYTHQASLIYLDEKANMKDLIKAVTEYLTDSLKQDFIFGITPAIKNGIIIRLLGNKAEQLFDYLQLIAKDFCYKEQIIIASLI